MVDPATKAIKAGYDSRNDPASILPDQKKLALYAELTPHDFNRFVPWRMAGKCFEPELYDGALVGLTEGSDFEVAGFP